MWINCKSNWLEVVFQQLSSASFSTQKSDHGGISLSLLSHVDETPFFFSSPSLLHQTLYPRLLYFSCCTLFTRPGTTANGKRNKRRKKKRPGQKPTATTLGMHVRGSCFSDLLGPKLPRDLCLLLWRSDDGDAPFPAWMSHPIFTQSSGISSFRNFHWACVNCIF